VDAIEWTHEKDGDADGDYISSHGKVTVTVKFAPEHEAVGQLTLSVNKNGEFDVTDSEVTESTEESSIEALEATLADLGDTVADRLTRDFDGKAEDACSESVYEFCDSEEYSRDPEAYYGVKGCF